MVKVLCLIFFITLFGCARIFKSDIKRLIPKDQIGVYNSSFSTNGYYYKLDKLDSHNFIEYYIFDSKGYLIRKATHVDFSKPNVSFDSLHKVIKKEVLNPQPPLQNKDLFLLNKIAQVWDTGIFRVEGSIIHVQQFLNRNGDYILNDYEGIIENDTILRLLQKKNFKDVETYKFMRTKIGLITGYVKENPNKFWKK